MLSKISCCSPFLPLLLSPHHSFTFYPSVIPLYLVLLLFPLIYQTAWSFVSVFCHVCAVCLYLFLSKRIDSFVLSIHDMVIIRDLFKIFHRPFMNMRMLYVILSLFNTFLWVFLPWLQCTVAWPVSSMEYFSVLLLDNPTSLSGATWMFSFLFEHSLQCKR